MKEKFELLIIKELSNDINDDESRQLDQWLEASKENRLIFKTYQKTWDRGGVKWKVENAESVYKNISGKLGLHVAKPPVKRAKSRTFIRLGMAAAVALLVGIAMLFYFDSSKPTKPVPEISRITKSNPKGVKSQFRLPDGTIVKLNSNSYIEFLSPFDADSREVFLEGEAFFEVVKDESRPFILRAGNIETTVLGTSFNVKAHAEQSEISVALVTGEILVKSVVDSIVTQQLILKPYQMITYDQENDQIEKSTFELEEVIGWKEGVLVLKNAGLDQIKRQLEDWYGLDIRYVNLPQGRSDITANFRNEPLENVLQSLGHTLKFEYQINDKNVEIKFLNTKKKGI